jgi:putative ABC transport system permease protein
MSIRWLRRIAYWFRFRARQGDLREELELHRDLRASEFERQGLSRDAARTAARRAMGNETYMREEARSVWLSVGLDGVLKDWSHAWRGLRRSPVFTVVVVLTLALGIGANTAIFSVMHHLILAPLPYPDGNRIVALQTATAGDPTVNFGVSAEQYLSWRARSRTLDEFAADRRGRFRIGNDTAGDTVSGAAITPSFLPMLRVHPVRGRGFTVDDASPGAAPVAMIGHKLWHLRYGGARDAVGKVIELNGIPRIIVGIMPIDMGVPMSDGMDADVWLPLNIDSADAGEEAFARLRPGVTSEMATRELQSIMSTLPEAARFKNLRAWARSASDLVDAQKRRAIQVLFVAVAGLLLIACANVANLLLMRARTRQREFAVRQALGAGRLRLARQLLTESVTLAVLGGGLGLLSAWQGLRTIVALRPGKLSDLDGVHIDASVLLWTAGISLATGLLFGMGPALLSGGQSMSDGLRAGIRTAVGNRTARRLHSGLLVAEIALSLMFLVAAGLLVRSFIALERAPIGFDPDGLVAVSVRLAHEPAPADRETIIRALVESLGSIPGVSQLASGPLPQTLVDVRTGPFATEGPAGPQPLDVMFFATLFVESGYFHVAGVPIVQGRGFDATDPTRASRELVVNQTLAKRLWPDGRALGAKLRIGQGARAEWVTVVGVAGDLHLRGITGDIFNLQMYRPTNVAPRFMNTVVLRTKTALSTLEPALRQAVDRAGVSATLTSVATAESMLNERVFAGPRFALVLFGVFAVIALVLSAVGLYGIIAYAVTQHTREIGIRIALGADSGVVARLILGDSVHLVIAGGCIGLLGAHAATRTLASFLYQTSPTDPVVFGGVALLITVVALIASLVPMRRALRIDPIDALRVE